MLLSSIGESGIHLLITEHGWSHIQKGSVRAQVVQITNVPDLTTHIPPTIFLSLVCSIGETRFLSLVNQNASIDHSAGVEPRSKRGEEQGSIGAQIWQIAEVSNKKE